MSIDIKKRLQGYQTYSPLRDYKIENYDFVFNKKETEQQVLNNFQFSIESGEWIKNTKSIEILNFVRNLNNVPREPDWYRHTAVNRTVVGSNPTLGARN